MGITPIEYRPWDGKRTEYYRRFLVISKNVFGQKLKSKWILAILIIGIILTHVFSIIFMTILPHEKLNPEMMVGDDPEDTQEEGPKEAGGNFRFLGIVTLNGSLFLEGDVYGFGTLVGFGDTFSGMVPTDSGFILITGTILLDGELNLLGGVSGMGYLEGDYTVFGSDISQINAPFVLEGTMRLNDTEPNAGLLDLDGNLMGEGNITGDGTIISNTTFTQNGMIFLNGTMVLSGKLEIAGNLTGNGMISGDLFASGFKLSQEEPDQEDEVVINERGGGYLTSGLLVIFTILLVSLVCSDLIASDLGDNSFILFFSRPIKTFDYLAGKIVGALWLLGLFCFLPLIIFCIAVMGTQSGSDYGTSLNVLGSTILAGLLTSFIFIPYGIFISSMTKRKSYATIGIFMSLFVLTIIGTIFSNFDKNWILIDPTRMLNYSYAVLYGFSIPEGINGTLHGAILFLFMVVPLILVYLRIHLKGVGK
ncbi:MAG: ABC transporter permease subunit [Thermoplasmata archaeon]|nr:MAG: ABC transporter permease subunit [Thermoplasmata archaeon]